MLTIEKAKVEDSKKIYKIIKECADYMYKENGLEHWIPYYPIEKIKKDIEEKDVFVLIEEKCIIGTFTLSTLSSSVWEKKCHKNAIYLSKLAIEPQKEGKGYGTFCIKFIEEYAKNNETDFIRFDVYEESKSAIEFYKKRGYKQVDIANTRRFKVVLMEKVLERECNEEENNDNRSRHTTSIRN